MSGIAAQDYQKTMLSRRKTARNVELHLVIPCSDRSFDGTFVHSCLSFPRKWHERAIVARKVIASDGSKCHSQEATHNTRGFRNVRDCHGIRILIYCPSRDGHHQSWFRTLWGVARTQLRGKEGRREGYGRIRGRRCEKSGSVGWGRPYSEKGVGRQPRWPWACWEGRAARV